MEYAYDGDGHLVEVRSPLVSLSASSPEQQLSTRYEYLEGTNADLRDNLAGIVDAAGRRYVSLAYGMVKLVPGTSTEQPDYDWVTSQRYGDTATSNQELTYAYQISPLTLRMETTTVTDRRGTVTENRYGPRGHLTRRTVRHNPAIPDGDARDVVTSYRYSLPSGRLTEITHPEGNITRYLYDGATSFCAGCAEGVLDTYRSANITSVIELPGPRGSSIAQRQIWTSYEPIYNQVRTTTDAVGYVTSSYFDFDELDCASADHDALLAHVAAWQMNIPASESLCGGTNLGGQGTSRGNGNVVRVESPAVTDRAGGGAPIVAVTRFHYGLGGQRMRRIDAEGYVTGYLYWPESSPHGGPEFTPDPPGRLLDRGTGGYLHTTVVDATDWAREATTPPPLDLTTEVTYDASAARWRSSIPAVSSTGSAGTRSACPCRLRRPQPSMRPGARAG